MIKRIRITASTHDGKYMSWETTPIQIEEASGDLLKWIYESMVEEEQRHCQLQEAEAECDYLIKEMADGKTRIMLSGEWIDEHTALWLCRAREEHIEQNK